jgi:hypothetical protein
MSISENSTSRAAGALNRRVPGRQVNHPPQGRPSSADGSRSFSPAFISDVFAGSVPVTGMFAHTVNMESLVVYPQGDAVYLSKGRASIETCQSGVTSNLMGTLALAGAGLMSSLGLAAAALPVAGLGLSALLFSGATNAFTRREIASASQ